MADTTWVPYSYALGSNGDGDLAVLRRGGWVRARLAKTPHLLPWRPILSVVGAALDTDDLRRIVTILNDHEPEAPT